jgi:hypothetical protein
MVYVSDFGNRRIARVKLSYEKKAECPTPRQGGRKPPNGSHLGEAAELLPDFDNEMPNARKSIGSNPVEEGRA